MKQQTANSKQQTANSKQQTAVLFLLLTNIITLFFLIIVSLHYNLPQKILIKIGIIEDDYPYSKYDVRNSLFAVYQTKKYEIVMLGDSITAGVEWNELFGISNIANRGIGSDTTEGFYNRLKNIYAIKPKMCFIMGGINDIGFGISVEKTLNNMKRIVEGLKENQINPIVQSTLYIAKGQPNWIKVNEAVDELNNGLKNMCEENSLIFIDVNKVLSINGYLKREYTYDGVHLYGIGYEEWKKLIMPIIENKSFYEIQKDN
jgi:lysophospholipase L1-like esterase